jgi:transcription antitermination factor NusG
MNATKPWVSGYREPAVRSAKILPFPSREPQFSYAPGKHWFAVYTNIKSEDRAQRGLDAAGFRTYLPQSSRWVTKGKIKVISKRPLMSRYLFVEVNPHRVKLGFEAVRQTDGVEAIIANVGVPTVIPSDLVFEMLRRQMEGEFDEAKDQAMTTGSKVKIVSGQWDELIGVITSGTVNGDGGSVMVKLLNDRRAQRIGAYALRAHLT